MSREALVLLVCCCDFRDGAERLIPSKSLRNAVIRAFPGLFCILRMCAPRRAAAVVRPRGREKSADRRRRILISRLLIIRASVPRRKSPFPAYFRGFPAVSPLIPPYPAFLKYPVSPHRACAFLMNHNTISSLPQRYVCGKYPSPFARVHGSFCLSPRFSQTVQKSAEKVGGFPDYFSFAHRIPSYKSRWKEVRLLSISFFRYGSYSHKSTDRLGFELQ